MKEVSGIGKGIFNFCKAYLQWANQVGENHKVPEKLLNKMIRKGQFKSLEDAERATKITIKLVLFSAPVIFILILTLSIIPKSANQSAAVKTTESSTPAQSKQFTESSNSTQISKAKSPQQAEQTKNLPESKETSIQASVRKTGLDFSYETSGKVQESGKNIIVIYVRNSKCGATAPVDTQRQEWQTTFDLVSRTWTDKVRELSSCLAGTSNQEWIDYSTNPSRFTIESNGNETIIRADAQDDDGSLILKDALVVKYTQQLNSAFKPDSATSQTVDKPSSSNGIIQAGDGYANLQILPSTEATVDKPSSSNGIIQAGDGYANLRSLPSTEGIVLAKIPNGTSANILSQQTNSSEQLWYKVQVDEHVGWIFSDLLKPNLATSTAVVLEPVVSPSFVPPQEYRFKSESSFETNHKSRKGRKRRK